MGRTGGLGVGALEASIMLGVCTLPEAAILLGVGARAESTLAHEVALGKGVAYKESLISLKKYRASGLFTIDLCL